MEVVCTCCEIERFVESKAVARGNFVSCKEVLLAVSIKKFNLEGVNITCKLNIYCTCFFEIENIIVVKVIVSDKTADVSVKLNGACYSNLVVASAYCFNRVFVGRFKLEGEFESTVVSTDSLKMEIISTCVERNVSAVLSAFKLYILCPCLAAVTVKEFCSDRKSVV